MRLETRTLYSLLLPHHGLGAPRARPPERSGDRGAPRATAKGVCGGEAPRIRLERSGDRGAPRAKAKGSAGAKPPRIQVESIRRSKADGRRVGARKREGGEESPNSAGQ